MSRELKAPLKEVVTEILTDLMTAEKGNDELWDLPPELIVILNPDSEDGKARVAFLELPEQLWMVGDTWKVIATIAAALHTEDAPKPGWPIRPGDVVLGAMVRVEGWGVAGKRAPKGLDADALKAWHDEQQAELEREWKSEGKRLVDHPHAIEVKSYCAVTVEGDSLSYTVYRKPKYDDLDVPEDGITDNADGRLYDVLKYFMEGVKKLEVTE